MGAMMPRVARIWMDEWRGYVWLEGVIALVRPWVLALACCCGQRELSCFVRSFVLAWEVGWRASGFRARHCFLGWVSVGFFFKYGQYKVT